MLAKVFMYMPTFSAARDLCCSSGKSARIERWWRKNAAKPFPTLKIPAIIFDEV